MSVACSCEGCGSKKGVTGNRLGGEDGGIKRGRIARIRAWVRASHLQEQVRVSWNSSNATN